MNNTKLKSNNLKKNTSSEKTVERNKQINDRNQKFKDSFSKKKGQDEFFQEFSELIKNTVDYTLKRYVNNTDSSRKYIRKINSHIYKKFGKYKPKPGISIDAWLKIVIKNKVIDLLRIENKIDDKPGPIDDAINDAIDNTTPESILIDIEETNEKTKEKRKQVKKVKKALKKHCSSMQQLVFNLRIFQEKSVEKTSNILGIDKQRVSEHLSRAQKKLIELGERGQL